MDFACLVVKMALMKTRFLGVIRNVLATGISFAFLSGAAAAGLGTDAIIQSEFISDPPVVKSVHASTIAETDQGLVAAWFGGSEEGAPDVGIWLSRNDGFGWSAPEEVATGIDTKTKRRFPCWNPVLHFRPQGDLLLFYRVGPSPREWWTYVRLSRDGGRSWARIRELPKGFLGPIKNKPIELANNVLLCGSSREDAGWRVHLEWTEDPFGQWFKTKPLNESFVLPAIQPTIVRHDEVNFQLLCRTKRGYIAQAWSTNSAVSWSKLRRTVLPNPNSGIDAVQLVEGQALLAYNHAEKGRGQLNLAVSEDGQVWQAAAQLEDTPGSEFSYPAIIQTMDGMVHLTYTWERQKIKHLVIDPARLPRVPMPGGEWPE